MTPRLRAQDTIAPANITHIGGRVEPVELWRCRECGKWSPAKRRPGAHKRWHHVEGEPRYVGWFVWCGPFDRYIARHDDPTPAAPLGGDGSMLGTPVSHIEKDAALDMAAVDRDYAF